MISYEAALEKIHGFSRFGSRLGLSRMYQLMALLDNPQDRVRVIHVAGTNGKGSVCRYIYSILREGGYKVGLYTSPFLERFTERIEYDGAEISKIDVANYTEQVLDKVDLMIAEGHESPTEFEIITAIAFCYFADNNTDFLVLEVGLGGSGDSTNIVKDPAICVITSIAYDHMDYLGESLEEIAAEKAGIIKHGVPVVVNVKDQGAKAVIMTEASSKESHFHDASAYSIENLKESLADTVFDVQIQGADYKNIEIAMIGRHQAENAVCALAAIHCLREQKAVTLSDQQVYNGIRKARQPGRMEILQCDPYVIIDGAHNSAGAAALAEVVRTHFKGKKILLVMGMLKDKQVDEMLTSLLALADDLVVTEPENPRKLPGMELAAIVSKMQRSCIVMPEISDAIAYAMENKGAYHAVIFAGSLYLIGKVRTIINETT